ncbi:MAG: sulfotransferase family protein [Paracoccaceae bacterium]
MAGSASSEGGKDGRGRLRSALHSAVPSHFNDPFGLAMRILRSGDRDAFAAVLQAALRLGLAPLDAALAALSPAAGADAPTGPLLFVTGPPRSGTTLLYQLIVRSLPVAYLTNLASLMPRSAAAGAFPLTASIANRKVRLESYYGRTRALSGSSDGLEFWDAWVGPDRSAVPSAIPPEAARAMRRFFAVFEARSGRPVVCKNNNLLAYAHLVAEALPTAHFVCLTRDPLYLAQSLLKARRDIHGDEAVGYGIAGTGSAEPADPVDDVWRQVRFYDSLTADQRARIGPGRFSTVSYEHLCEDPAGTVGKLAAAVFGFTGIAAEIPPLRPMQRQTLADETFRRLSDRRPP